MSTTHHGGTMITRTLTKNAGYMLLEQTHTLDGLAVTVAHYEVDATGARIRATRAPRTTTYPTPADARTAWESAERSAARFGFVVIEETTAAPTVDAPTVPVPVVDAPTAVEVPAVEKVCLRWDVEWDGNRSARIMLGDRVVASRAHRDDEVLLGAGVTLVAGGFAARGRSRERPFLMPTPGTVLEVTGVPRAVAERAAAGDEDITIIQP